MPVMFYHEVLEDRSPVYVKYSMQYSFVKACVSLLKSLGYVAFLKFKRVNCLL